MNKESFLVLVLAILSVLGVLVSFGALWTQYFQVKTGFCEINNYFTCEKVLLSPYGYIDCYFNLFASMPVSACSSPGKIPVSAIGILGYGALAALSLFFLFVKSTSLKNKIFKILLVGAIGAFLFSWYLFYLEIAVIKAFCIFCLASLTIITLILINIFAMNSPRSKLRGICSRV